MKACLILGNGPSLNDVPADVLGSMDSFGMNYAKHQPTYFVCVDTTVLTEHADEIYLTALGAKKTYLSHKHMSDPRPAVAKLYRIPGVELVFKDDGAFRPEQFLSGMTATYVCLKLAYYAGFTDVHLWGVDHSLDWKHYRDDYAPGVVTTPERMKLMEWHYQLAMNVFARAGRRIFNHSNPSRLDMIFRRGDIMDTGDKTHD